MKKSSFQKGSSLGRSVRVLTPGNLRSVVIALVVIVAVVIIRFVFPGTLTHLAAPIWKAGEQTTASVGTVGNFFTDKAHLANEVDRLRTENEGLANNNALLSAQVADLTRLLGTRSSAEAGIVAGVLARPPVSPYDVLIVDAGELEGVKSGAQVFGNGGIPVGTVASMSPHNARVLLYSAPGRETAAWIGEKRTAVTLVGQGSGAFTTTVAREAGVVSGDGIYAAGPGSLPIATVLSVENDPSAPTARVRVTPITNPFSITWVSISRTLAL